MLNIDELSYEQLQSINDSLEEFLFKQPLAGQESFSPIFRKDPKAFRKLINELVSFKRDVMAIFNKMYADRWNLVNFHTVTDKPAYMKFDESDQYFFDQGWQKYQTQMAQTIEDHKKRNYALGILALLLLYKAHPNISVDDAQSAILTQALQAADFITQTTKKRIADQIQASLKLNEDRNAFEDRLKNILTNQYRGRLIAEHEGLQSFLDGQDAAAVDVGFQYKTWVGLNPIDSICGDVNGKTVGIDDVFPNGLDGPLAHFNCKCDLWYSNNPGDQ